MDILTNISLFSGVGGLDLAAKWTGRIKTVAYCENDRYAQAVLMSRIRDGGLDDAPIWDDVTTFDGRPWRGRVDIVSGGGPCQPHSRAGKHLGEKDSRNLWPSFMRIVKDVGPRFVLFENVPGILESGYAATLLVDLEKAEYCATPIGISACSVGASHPRKRVFFLAHSKREGFKDFGCEKQARWSLPAPSYSQRIWDKPAPEPAISRMAYGLAKASHRLRCGGNGVVPQQALPAWEEIIRLYDS